MNIQIIQNSNSFCLLNKKREFQRLHKLKQTGTMNEETIAKLETPRCGMPDVESQTNSNSKLAEFSTCKSLN
jgi:hypothetical protein